MLVSSIVAYIVLRKITIGNNSDDIEEAEAKPVIENEESEDDSFSPENYILIRRAGEKSDDGDWSVPASSNESSKLN